MYTTTATIKAISVGDAQRPNLVGCSIFIWDKNTLQWGAYTTLAMGQHGLTRNAFDEQVAISQRKAVSSYGTENVCSVYFEAEVPQPTPAEVKSK